MFSSGKTESIELEDLSRASATQTTDNANVQEVTNHSDAVEVPGEEVSVHIQYMKLVVRCISSAIMIRIIVSHGLKFGSLWCLW